jgi:hypothetical protein
VPCAPYKREEREYYKSFAFPLFAVAAGSFTYHVSTTVAPRPMGKRNDSQYAAGHARSSRGACVSLGTHVIHPTTHTIWINQCSPQNPNDRVRAVLKKHVRSQARHLKSQRRQTDS